jgi:hypothetical protein
MKMRRIVETEKCRGRILMIFFPVQIWQLESYVISILTGKASLQ